MFYRRKVILALIQMFGGKLSKLDFQKLLFLFSQIQKEPSYDFLPYRFGCYSAQVNQDLKTMIKYDLVEENPVTWIIKTKTNYNETVKPQDREFMKNLYSDFKNLKGESLIQYVYKKFPFYAIRSEIAEKILKKSELEIIQSLQPNKKESVLFTIGYEGKSVEKYVTQLLNESVKVLCDVRKNPFSMKYGFSKSQLKKILENVGIESDKIKNLKQETDYQNLFVEYEKNILPKMTDDLKRVSDICKKNKRVALTCFEKEHTSCHRSRTANALLPLLSNKFSLEHI
ncbi:MAG: DUF488 domain-containing protein [Leptospiraceae bacterium]|nr:DUF488 domain-containing protein [Leptospiraceae bacterium]